MKLMIIKYSLILMKLVFNQGSNAINSAVVVKILIIIDMSNDNDKITVTITDNRGNSLEGKEIIFKIDNNIIKIGTTNINGERIIYYKNAYKNKVIANFVGDYMYDASNGIYTPKPNSNPIPADDSINPKQGNILASVTMKKTEMLIITALLLLLTSLGLFIRRK